MEILLHILLLLAFLSSIVVTVALRQPWGPEGPVGAWLLFVFPCLFVAVLLFALASKGLKIRRAGGDLHPQLRAWHALLQKSKGLETLAAFVGTLL